MHKSPIASVITAGGLDCGYETRRPLLCRALLPPFTNMSSPLCVARHASIARNAACVASGTGHRNENTMLAWGAPSRSPLPKLGAVVARHAHTIASFSSTPNRLLPWISTFESKSSIAWCVAVFISRKNICMT